MRALNVRTGGRLNLESLESRTLLSTTLLPPAGPHVAAVVAHQPAATVHAAAAHTSVNFRYGWSLDHAVFVGTNPTTHTGRSSGNVAFGLYRQGTATAILGGAPRSVPVALIVTNSAARWATPDHFHATVTLHFRLRDANTGAWAQLTFHGTISGKLSAGHSTLTLSFRDATQRFVLGGHVYTVRLPAGMHLGSPHDGATQLDASVQVVRR
jgi:hypothetical protein